MPALFAGNGGGNAVDIGTLVDVNEAGPLTIQLAVHANRRAVFAVFTGFSRGTGLAVGDG
jgi:hypothetical protein